MEKNLKKNVYIYNWITLLYTWNIANQLYFNKNKTKKQSRGWKDLGDWDWRIYNIDSMYKIDN